MKNLALIIILSATSVVLNAEGYTIQTISTLKESSITPAFEKKVQKSTLPSVKNKEGECNIVTVGHYDTVKNAKQDLAKAKKIAKDAFVRPIERTTPKVCLSHQAKKETHAMAVDTNATVVTAKKEESVTRPSDINKTAMVSAEPAAAIKSVEALPVETKTEPCVNNVSSSASTTVMVYDRNLARKSDIHEAIEYYEKSPYYSFKPLAIQR